MEWIQMNMFPENIAPNPKKKSGEQLKEEGIQRAMDNSNKAWKDFASMCVRAICLERGVGGKFTADDINKLLDETETKVQISTHNNSAMGGIFKTMCSKGWIEHSGYTKSRRPASHARIIGVWKVLKIV